MGTKRNISYETKLNVVLECIEGKTSINAAANTLCVNWKSIKKWIINYQSMGSAGLITLSKNKQYPKELKLNAIQDYLSGKGSLNDISKKYKIRSSTQLSDWIMKYTSHVRIKSSQIGGNQIMTKGRTTTFDEKVEIVKYCIEHDKNYNETAEKYQVSYQQVRSWTAKYEELGVNALCDNRGRRKPSNEMSELEQLKAQNKLLEAKNKRLELENEVLKKLEEIERRWS